MGGMHESRDPRREEKARQTLVSREKVQQGVGQGATKLVL